MKTTASTLILLFALCACSGEKSEPATPAPATVTEQAPPTATTAATTSQPAEPEGDADPGTWAGQLRIDAHAGTAVLNYVGAESGDFVPLRFRTGSDVGKKILAVCADDDLCEIEGSVRFLDEAPPENASAVGEIVSVQRVKKLPPDA